MKIILTKEIRSIIDRNRPNKLYMVSDSAHLNNDGLVTCTLFRLEKEGMLIRISQGLYLYPLRNKFGILHPSIEDITYTIAEKGKARIIPRGLTTLNKLGLSTQVMMIVVYLTNATSKELTIGNCKIIFKRSVPRNFAYKTDLLPLIVVAMKELGKDNVTDEQIAIINKSLRNVSVLMTLNMTTALLRNGLNKDFTKLIKEEKQLTILANVVKETRIVENAVENYYFVSMVLRAIFSLSYVAACVLEGISFSKGWGLIERFSEDICLVIDLQYLGFTNIETKSQRTKLRKDSPKFIDGILALDVTNRLKEFGILECCKVIILETFVSYLEPVGLFVEYNSVLQTKIQYILERVKVNISCRSLMEPSEDIEMCSMIEEAYPGEDFSLSIFTVPTIVPGRIFWENIFLLHKEFNSPNGCTHIELITRHMYDIVKMMDKSFAYEAMNNWALYNDIVAHRKFFTA